MEKNTEIMCRTCLEILQSSSSKHDIFQTPDLAKKLIDCTSLFVEANDNFPKYLCNCCYAKVNEFYHFQTMSIESVQRFRDIIQRQGKTLFQFEDEKPVFDLEAHEKQKITVEDSELLLQPETCIASLETDLNISTRRSRRTTTPACNYFEEDVSEDRTDDDEIAIDLLSCVRINNVEKRDSLALKDSRISSKKYQNNIKPEQVKARKKRKEPKRNRSNITRSERSKRRHRKCIGNRSYSKSRLAVKKSQVYQCDACPLRFFVEHRLIAHKRSHDGLMPYPCNFEGCDKGFNRWHCLNEHLKQHEGTNTWYTCSEEGCGKVYKHKPTLSMHLRKYHKKGPELKSHVCEICGKVFKSSAILNDHRYTHKDKSELPFACNEPNCDRRFSSKEKLKVHGMRHAGIKNYVCPHCGMRKTTRNELKIHINYHTLERTWPCRFCQHVCNSAGNLKMHVRTVHERAKDYACRFCERTFAKPDTRKYHEMTHTGEKPNECKECGKRFTQPAALRTHRKIHLRHRSQTMQKHEDGETTALAVCNDSTDKLNICNSSPAVEHHHVTVAQTTCAVAPSMELIPDVVSHVQDFL